MISVHSLQRGTKKEIETELKKKRNQKEIEIERYQTTVAVWDRGGKRKSYQSALQIVADRQVVDDGSAPPEA